LTVLIRLAGFQQQGLVAERADALSRFAATEGTAERSHLHIQGLSSVV